MTSSITSGLAAASAFPLGKTGKVSALGRNEEAAKLEQCARFAEGAKGGGLGLRKIFLYLVDVSQAAKAVGRALAVLAIGLLVQFVGAVKPSLGVREVMLLERPHPQVLQRAGEHWRLGAVDFLRNC